MRFDIRLKSLDNLKLFSEYILLNKRDNIYLKQGRYKVSAKSILGILSLNLLDNIELNVEEPDDDFYDFYKKIYKMGIVQTEK